MFGPCRDLCARLGVMRPRGVLCARQNGGGASGYDGGCRTPARCRAGRPGAAGSAERWTGRSPAGLIAACRPVKMVRASR